MEVLTRGYTPLYPFMAPIAGAFVVKYFTGSRPAGFLEMETGQKLMCQVDAISDDKDDMIVHIFIHMYVYIYMYIYMYIYVYIYKCVLW